MKIATNHITVKLDVPEGMIYMYDVTVVPPWSHPYKRSDKKLYHDTVALWKVGCTSMGVRRLQAALQRQEARQRRLPRGDQPDRVPMVVRDISRVADIRVTREILEWATSGRSGWVPQDAIQALDVVLKQAVSIDINFENIGTFSSLRPISWKSAQVLLTLNVDTANKPVTKVLHLTKDSAAGKGDSYFYVVLAATSQEMISLDNDSVSVAEYFKQQFPALPCLAEFLSMTSQPLQRKKKLADDAESKIIKQKAVKLRKRQAKIMTKKNNDKYRKGPFAKEYGISVADEVRIVMTSPRLTPSSR
jgi:hypothetical protein